MIVHLSSITRSKPSASQRNCVSSLGGGIDLTVDIPSAQLGWMKSEDMLRAGFAIKKPAFESLKGWHQKCVAVRRFCIYREYMKNIK